MQLNTRILLAITAWAALNYAMAFTIPPNLLAFMALQFLAHTVAAVAILLPLFLGRRKHRTFCLAFSISAIGLIAFSMSKQLPNPVAGYLTQFVFQLIGVNEASLFDNYGIDYANGFVGQWHAMYKVVELHTVLIFGLISGIVWEKAGRLTPLWLIGLWLFLWAISISKEIFGVGTDWSPLIGYLLSIVTIFVLPAIAILHGKWKPFSLSFAIAGCLGCLQLQSNIYGPQVFSNVTIARTFPNMPASVGEHAVQFIVLALALIIATCVQVAVIRYTEDQVAES